MSARLTVFLVLFLSLLSAWPLNTRQDGSRPSTDGALAPPNCWYTVDGCAARSSAAATRPLRGPLERAWEFELPGTLEGEPLVWEDTVLISCRTDSGTRLLQVLNLRTGKTGKPKEFKTPLPLEPSIWGDRVVLRSKSNALAGYRIEGGELTSDWRFKGPDGILPPLLFGSEVYYLTPQSFERIDYGGHDPDWTQSGTFRGRPSLRANRVYGVRYAPDGGAWIVALDRYTGEKEGQLLVGISKGALPAENEDTRVALLDRDILIRHSQPLLVSEYLKETYTTSWLPRPMGSAWLRYENLTGVAAPFRKGWFGLVHSDKGEQAWWARPESQEFADVLIADKDSHPELLGTATPTTVADGVSYLGGAAFDQETLRILWNLEGDFSGRAIPARRTLLLVEDGKRLVAMRQQTGADERERAAAAAAAGGVKVAADQAVAVLQDGSVHRGSFELRPADGVLVELRGSDEVGRHPFHEVLFAESKDGMPLCWSSSEDALFAMNQFIRKELAEGYTELALDSLKTNDAKCIRMYLREALAAGADANRLKSVTRKLESLAAKPAKVHEDRVEELEAECASLAALPADYLWQRAQNLDPEAQGELFFTLLDEILQRKPDHAAAAAWVRERIPAGMKPADPFPAREWLRFVRAAAITPIAVVAEGADAPGPAIAGPLSLAKESWREDLTVFHSSNLLVLTPPSQSPGAVARCLSLGELICQALDGIFGQSEAAIGRDPLTLHLYLSQDEYEKAASEGDEPAGRSPARTAGYYESKDHTSRIYLPATEDAFHRVMSTYAHALTHHWLAVRCPLFSQDQAKTVSNDTEGLWAVEGFASMIEEFDFDLDGRRWSAFNPQAMSLDVVANAAEKELLPWRRVFKTTRRQYESLGTVVTAHVPMTWYAGGARAIDRTRLFHCQAAAACHYLFHADGGRHRAKLLQYLADFYTGKTGQLDVEQVFGLDETELGARIVAFAKEPAR